MIPKLLQHHVNSSFIGSCKKIITGFKQKCFWSSRVLVRNGKHSLGDVAVDAFLETILTAHFFKIKQKIKNFLAFKTNLLI
jgi:hypothetical protein